MKYSFLKFFSFSAYERKGIFILIFIIIILALIQVFLKLREPSITQQTSQSKADMDIEMFEKGLTVKSDCTWSETDYGFTGELFLFNPNIVAAADMKRLGLPNNLIRTILRYRAKGGKFYRKEDLLRIYGMDDAQFYRLSPFVILEHPETKRILPPKPRPEATNKAININLADSALIESLPGIGPVYARRIINYRRILGGFYGKNQLAEVYGLPDSVLAKIEDRIIIDTNYVIKINVNAATEAELSRHPYIGWHTARGIVKYRMQVKEIKHLRELIDNGLISTEAFNRLEKYLTI
jgi:DNA uptake protein ComE-like DNA-binding protein